jgi:hypothetical protein
MKSKSKSFFVLILAFSLLNFSNYAKASNLCLSSFPDSAWDNGEPVEVKSQLNFELVGIKRVNIALYDKSPTQLDVLVQGTTNLTSEVEYEYKGKNCETRLVKIRKNVTGPTLNIIDKSGMDMEVTNRSQNFIEANDVKKNIEGLISKIGSSYTIQKNQGESFYVEDISIVLQPEINRFGRFPLRLVFSSEPASCSFESTTNGNKQNIYAVYSMPRTRTPNLPIKFLSETCGIKIYIYFTTSYYKDSKTIEVKDSLFEVGKIRLDSSPKPLVIKCVKGKKTKIVKGIQPRCPKGYK